MSLYPPIVEDILPAFVINDQEEEEKNLGIKIPFQVSPYNDTSPQEVHISISTQYDNQTAFNKSRYPLELKAVTSQHGFVRIRSSNLASGRFQEDLYYKVQLRFSSEETEPWYEGSDERRLTADYLTANTQYFSEWSKPCLIKRIPQPTMKIEGLDLGTSANNPQKLMQKFNKLEGNLTFAKTTQEHLYSYRIKIKDSNGDTVDDSGERRPFENSNSFEYVIKKNLEDFTLHQLEIKYTTSSGYKGSNVFYFIYETSGLPVLDTVFIEANPDRPKGGIKIQLNSNKALSENIMVRKTSNKTNFTVWEDVRLIPILEEGAWPQPYTFIDFLVEPGVVYKYGFQRYRKLDSELESRGEMPEAQTVYGVAAFDDIFLFDGQKQLRIKYDPNISSFKHQISESRLETIGSKYPWINRNASVNYRTFPISGLITYKMDEYANDYPYAMIPVSQQENYSSNGITPKVQEENDYMFYNRNNTEINQYKTASGFEQEDLDFVLEKKFRDEVTSFLQNGKVKLFKSETEGNIIVRLMDISFTPNKSLGRRIYSFSATAYEIDDYTIENCEKYGFFELGDYNKNALEKSRLYVGQKTHCSETNLDELLFSQRIIQKSSETITRLDNLHWFRIVFNSKPYKIDNNRYGYSITIKTSSEDKGSTFIIGPGGHFETSLKDFSSFAAVTINAPGSGYVLDYDVDYMSELIVTPNKDTDIIGQTKRTKVGQVRGEFKPGEDIARQIRIKYFVDYLNDDSGNNALYKDYWKFQRVEAINALDIEAPPGAVFYWRDSQDNYNNALESECLHEIGPTGHLHAYNEDGVVVNFSFKGLRLYQASDAETRSIIRPNEYKIYGTDIPSIQNAQYHGVYGPVDARQIFYNDKFYPINISADGSAIVECPIEAMVNYCVEIAQGAYDKTNKGGK